MAAGFVAAFGIGDLFLAVRGAPPSSVGFLCGVAGFSLAQAFWTVGQLREAKPDIRVLLVLTLPLSVFVLARLRPPVLSPAATAAVCAYSVLTAVSFATALATRRVFYVCGIGLLLFSDMMIGGRFLKMPGCYMMIGPTYVAAELCLLASFFLREKFTKIHFIILRRQFLALRQEFDQAAVERVDHPVAVKVADGFQNVVRKVRFK